MPTRPLLRLPTPDPVAMPAGPRGGGSIRFPSQRRQQDRFGPLFTRLRGVLDREAGALQLRVDPTSLAPERVIVFEIADTVANFTQAVGRIRGLEFMAEYEGDFVADADFAVLDSRKGHEGQDRADKVVPARFYLAMPDLQALREVLSLWERWQRGQALGTGLTPFKHLFAQLRSLRPWGPGDRIPAETVDFWREEIARHPDQPVRTEVELWFYQMNVAVPLRLATYLTSSAQRAARWSMKRSSARSPIMAR